jgi:hypothetical protein
MIILGVKDPSEGSRDLYLGRDPEFGDPCYRGVYNTFQDLPLFLPLLLELNFSLRHLTSSG